MRYIILTKDDEGNVGKLLKRLEKEKKIDILEKGKPIEEIKAEIQKLGLALERLKKTFIDEEIMEIYISKKSGLGLSSIRSILRNQNEFFRKIGLLK